MHEIKSLSYLALPLATKLQICMRISTAALLSKMSGRTEAVGGAALACEVTSAKNSEHTALAVQQSVFLFNAVVAVPADVAASQYLPVAQLSEPA